MTSTQFELLYPFVNLFYVLIQGVNLDEDIRLWIVNTHEVHINSHHYHSQPLITSALIHCNDYDKKVRTSNLFLSIFLYYVRIS